MSNDDAIPTPRSVAPPVPAQKSDASEPEEIRAKRPEPTQVILDAIDRLGIEVADIAKTTAAHGSTLQTLTNQVAENTRHIAAHSESIAAVSRASAIAAELSAQALAKVNNAQDEARKMVESAMAIQSGAIESAVRTAVQPIADDVETLKTSDRAQTEALATQTQALAAQNSQLSTVVSLLSQIAKWRRHRLFQAGLFVGGILAGLIWNWLSARGH